MDRSSAAAIFASFARALRLTLIFTRLAGADRFRVSGVFIDMRT